MENLNNTNKTSENAEKELRIFDVMRSANCYNALKAFLQEKKKSPRLCAWDSVHHQEIWDKMLELELKDCNVQVGSATIDGKNVVI